ncbi:MAG: hypothetical protein J6U85_03920 [Bacteroidales bacterium]|nr:hypothetical protein [Bacteroidales bacterium]
MDQTVNINFNISGVALNSSLADLSAIAGVTGDKLKEIEGYARDTAKTFGTDAASSVESYKLSFASIRESRRRYFRLSIRICPKVVETVSLNLHTTLTTISVGCVVR